MTRASKASVLHFAQEGDTSGFFPQLARGHDRSRFRMSFATLNPMEESLRRHLEAQGVRCFSCESRARSDYPVGLLRLARDLRQQHVDVIHAHLFEPSVIGLPAALLARTPLRVMTRHYSDYHTRIEKRWHVRLDQLCTRLSHRVIAVSSHTRDHMVSVEGAPAGKIDVVLNGIDFDRVRLSSPEAPARLRAEFGAAERHLLLIVARLHPEKGYEHLFAALPGIEARTGRRPLLLVAGTGALEASYSRLVGDLGVTDRVRFLGFRRDVPDLMAAADLLVLPSVAEAFGLVLAEALFLGVPVVATRVGGIPEIVDDGQDGVLVPPADSAALAEATAALLRDPDRRHRLGAAGRVKVLERFGFERMVRAYEAVYDRALAP
jgi:glycosyltransferase involved in cell wall biosynthesis